MTLALPAGNLRKRYFWIALLGFLTLHVWMTGLGYIGRNVSIFTLLYLGAFVLLIPLYHFFPDSWPAKQQWRLLLGLAIAIRLIFLLFPAAGDTCRYIWEGYVLNQGYNPYLYAADSPELAPFINDIRSIWEGMNHREAPACYPPFSMLTFQTAAFFSPTKFFFNIILLGFDIATVWVLLLLLKLYQLPLKRVMLFAFNPLVLLYIAGESHLDSIQNFFIWLSVYLFIREKNRFAFISLGLAVMSKYFSVILVPFWLHKKNWKAVFLLLGTIFLLYLPFWGTGMQLFTSLTPFGLLMHYNDSVTVLLRELFGLTNATPLSLFILAGCFGLIFLLVHHPLKRSYYAVGCLLLLISTLHPWYLVLMTPFLVFFPSRAWLYLHVSILFTFPMTHVLYYEGVFQEIHWLKYFEYLPFYLLLLWDAFRNRPYFTDREFSPVRTFSLIVPVLNEAQNIARCLEALPKHPALLETIVVDCGSRDATREIAEQKGANVLHSEKGRGHQIHAGISQARGDLFLILHADCVLEAKALDRILAILADFPQYIGGAFGMRYFQRPLSKRPIEWLNNARARWTGIAFGDQAQFFRREALDLIGGFPEQMLMEDVELSMRLKEYGALCFLPKGVRVSERRWEDVGFMPNVVKVLYLCGTYLLQRCLGLGDPNRQDFYERYYS
ncbi:MAG: glycosyltransferase family 2 protein [bacterium]|nr:glycosyltransferase family 2 protein [bacterium]